MSLVDYLTIAVFGWTAITVLSVSFSWVFARLYCRPKRRSPTQTPADHHLAYTPLTLVSHGVYLEGWIISPRPSPIPAPVIILAHGWSNNKAQMLPLAYPLYQAGFGVLLYDARGHGTSGGDGPITIAKFAEDLVAAIDYLEFIGIRPLLRRVKNRPDNPPILSLRGPYAYVRHPTYLLLLIAFWVGPVMTYGRLEFAALGSLYLIIGTFLEERNLRDDLGDVYDIYRANVPMCIPRLSPWTYEAASAVSIVPGDRS